MSKAQSLSTSAITNSARNAQRASSDISRKEVVELLARSDSLDDVSDCC